jgi:hypothetical protein
MRMCKCGEWLPHSCAAKVTVARERWTGRRIVTITDRQPSPAQANIHQLPARERTAEPEREAAE